MGRKYCTLYTKNISHIYKLKKIPFFLVKSIFTEIQLDISFFITEFAESGLAVSADNHNTACHFYMLFTFF